MTPQQANEVLRAALKKISETRFGWDGDCGVTGIANEALEDTADCAPAPTEPAVDRDAVTDGPVDANALERLAKTRPDECFLTGRGVLKLINAIRTLEQATPALPAVSAKPLHQVVAEWDAMPYAKAPVSPAMPEPTMPCWSCKKPYTAEQRLYADGRCPHCHVDIELDDDDAVQAVPVETVMQPMYGDEPRANWQQPVQAVPAPALLAPIPDVLFDGHAVYKSVMENDPHTPRPTADNISDVLDAVVRLLRASQPTSTPAPMHRLICQLASLKSRTPEAVNLLVEEAKRVMGQG